MDLILNFLNKDKEIIKTISCVAVEDHGDELKQGIYLTLFQNMTSNMYGVYLESDYEKFDKVLYNLYQSSELKNYEYLSYYKDDELLLEGRIIQNMTQWSIEYNPDETNLFVEKLLFQVSRRKGIRNGNYWIIIQHI